MYLCASIDSLNLHQVTCEVIDLNNYLLKEANEDNDFLYGNWVKAFEHPDKTKTYLVFMASYMFGTTKECFTNTTRFIRDKYPNSLIITGGVQASFDKKEILEANFADIVLSLIHI